MVRDAVRDREGRTDPGQHQSRLSPVRGRVRAQQSRLQGADHGGFVQVERLCRHAARAGAGNRPVRAGPARRQAPAEPARADPHRRQREARLFPLRRRGGVGPRPPFRAARRTSEDSAIRRRHQHPVHQRHHRRAQGRDADASQHPQQRLFRRARDELHRGGPAVHSGAALSLLRHGDGQSRLHHPRRGDGLFGRGVRPALRARNHRGGEMHRAVRRADHVHCRAEPSRLQALRSAQPCAPAAWRARRARSR